MQLLSSIRAFSFWRYAFAALVIGVIGAYFYFGRGTQLGTTLAITPGDFAERVSVSGTVTAAKNVDLGFAANGRIAGTYANVGQRVGAGAVLAETENGDLEAALREAQANLASLLAGTRPEELAVASIAVTNAQAALVTALQSAYTAADDAVHNKTDALFINPRANPKLSFTISNATLENAVERDRVAIEPIFANWALLVAKLSSGNAADSAAQAQTYLTQVTTLLSDANAALNQGLSDQTTSAATLSGYATALATARANVNSAATTLAAGSAALSTAQKSLALEESGATSESISAEQAVVAAAQAALAKSRVTAPFAGIVTRMDAKVGEIVAPTTSLISMQSDGVFQIEAYIPEVTIARVAAGNPATTTLDAYGSGVAFPAIVSAVDPAETMKDGVPTYKTTLTFLARDPRIRSGMTANVLITTGVLHRAIVIPEGAVGTEGAVPYVSVIDRGTVAKRLVTTGPSPALGQSQILSGLSQGDVILLTPAP